MIKNSDSILPLLEIGKGDSSRKRSLHHLPPGCRFHPSEEQILNHYLTGKNSSVAVNQDDTCGYDLIKELNLYDYQPSDLPDRTCFVYGRRGQKRHWFFYTESKGGDGRRRAKGGFWWRVGKVRDVFDGQKVALGTRTKFVFYKVNSDKVAVRTSCVMFEYALLHDLKASFVLCRVLVKSHVRNSISENILSTCADESASAVRHVGTQHHGRPTPAILEAKNNDPIAIGPVSIASFALPTATGIPPHLPYDLVGSQLTNNDLLSILEEDFIELEDLR